MAIPMARGWMQTGGGCKLAGQVLLPGPRRSSPRPGREPRSRRGDRAGDRADEDGSARSDLGCAGRMMCNCAMKNDGARWVPHRAPPPRSEIPGVTRLVSASRFETCSVIRGRRLGRQPAKLAVSGSFSKSLESRTSGVASTIQSGPLQPPKAIPCGRRQMQSRCSARAQLEACTGRSTGSGRDQQQEGSPAGSAHRRHASMKLAARAGLEPKCRWT